MNYSELVKRPAVIGVAAFILGILAGLIWGYGIAPVEWVDAAPNLLRANYQQDYLRMTIDSYRVNANEDMAVQRFLALGDKGAETFQAVKNNPGTVDPNVIKIFGDLLSRKNALAPLPGSTAAVSQTNNSASSGNLAVTISIIVGGLLAVGAVGGAAWLYRNRSRRAPSHFGTPPPAGAAVNRVGDQADYTSAGESPPLAQYVATYVLGDNQFDDSFSIDSPSGDFLGECGVDISETIGVGDPKKVTAFEIWLFDKNDIPTVTKVLMSQHAFDDEAIRTKLEAKGELMCVQPQAQIILETQTLQMSATITDMQYGQGALPDNSYFERFTLELAVWTRK